ncbi:MAG: SRPBCC family protein [Acidimicrobiia bacterium]
MGHIVRETTVSCPPAKVFEVLSHINRLPEFSEMTVDVKGPDRPLAVGDRFEQTVKVLGRELATEWEVVEVQAPSLLRVEGRSANNGSASLTDRVTPTPEGGSRVELEVDYDLPLGFLGEIADKLVVERKNEEEAETILRRLKELCEKA